MKKKLNLGSKLSANEQKGILGAAGCSTAFCSVYDPDSGILYTGGCGWQTWGTGYGICECLTNMGPYIPQGGTSACWSN